MTRLLEAGAWAAAIALLVFHLRSSLILGTSVLAHDHVYWGYPVFHFYAESLLSGRLPLWNPFTHGGEPFYPLLLQIRLLDLSSLLVTFIGRAVTTDLVVLYNWDRFVRGLILLIGVYLLLRPWTRHRLTRLALVVILCFSSFLWSPLRQMALADQFIFAPYVGIFLFRILSGDSRWRNWIALAGFFGLNWQSYFFTGTALFIFLVLLGCLLFQRSLLQNLISTPQLLPKAAVAGALVAGLCLPNLSLLLERNHFVFPARMLDPSSAALPPQGGPAQYEPLSGSERFGLLGLPYDLVYRTGSFSSIWDFIQMLAPFANAVLREGQSSPQFLPHRAWGGPSEAFLYIGMVPYCLAILGLLAGKHPLKRVWLVVGVGFGLVMLGPEAGLHALLYWLFPPMRFMRHSHALSLFFTTALLFLFVLGLDRLLTPSEEPLLSGPPERGALPPPVSALILGCFLVGTAIVMAKLRFPMKFYQIPLISLIAGAIWLGRRQVGDRWLFWTLITGHLAVVAIASRLFRADAGFLVLILVFLIVPLAVWVSHRNVVVLGNRGSPRATLALLFLLVIGDLFYYSSYVSRAVQWKRPDSFLAYQAFPRPPHFAETRQVFPEYPAVSPYQQVPRYLSVFYREPAAFTPLLEEQERRLRSPGDIPKEISMAVEGKRVNSLLMLKPYFDLITTPASTHVFAEVFAIGRPLIQLRQGFQVLTDPEARRLLETQANWRLVEWFRRYVILSPSDDGLPAGVAQVPVESFRQSQGWFDWVVEHYTYNSLRLKVRTEVPGLLYWADGYDPRWRAFVDGKEVLLYRANLNFKAVALPPGTHEVRFVYLPRRFLAVAAVFYAIQIGLALWGLGLLVASAGAKLTPRPEQENLEQDQQLRDVKHR